MVQYSILVDQDLCFGCHACEVACKQENNLPIGQRWIHVVQVGPRKVGGKMRLDFVPMMCKHCAKPPCMDVCPTKAITKRPNGIVSIDPELCNGCMACIQFCPFAVLSLNPEKNTVEKCTLCVDRVEKGLQPSCVQHCPARAMYFGDINEITEQIHKKYALKATSTKQLPVLPAEF